MPNYIKVIPPPPQVRWSHRLKRQNYTSLPKKKLSPLSSLQRPKQRRVQRTTLNTKLIIIWEHIQVLPPTMEPARTRYMGNYTSPSRRNTSKLIRNQATVSPNIRKLRNM